MTVRSSPSPQGLGKKAVSQPRSWKQNLNEIGLGLYMTTSAHLAELSSVEKLRLVKLWHEDCQVEQVVQDVQKGPAWAAEPERSFFLTWPIRSNRSKLEWQERRGGVHDESSTWGADERKFVRGAIQATSSSGKQHRQGRNLQTDRLTPNVILHWHRCMLDLKVKQEFLEADMKSEATCKPYVDVDVHNSRARNESSWAGGCNRG